MRKELQKLIAIRLIWAAIKVLPEGKFKKEFCLFNAKNIKELCDN
jgi:hypothetical protein